MINVVIVDHPGSGADGEDLHRIAAALQRQAREHIAPRWYLCDVSVSVATDPKPSDWAMGLFGDPDQPGAYGYHDVTRFGLPLAKVFPKLDRRDGAKLSTTLSHELAEMLVDPFLTRAVQDRQGRFWALEASDAVEQLEYEIDGVAVSDFVFPHYFEPPEQVPAGTMLDWMGKVSRPFEVLPGGYMQYFGPGGWHQVTHAQQAPRAYRAQLAGRAARRMARSSEVAR